MKPGGRKKISPTTTERGNPVNPLTLMQAYRNLPVDESGGFARPAPPPTPPLPLKFTCGACGNEVHPDASVCSSCLGKLYPPGGPGDRTR